MDLKIAGIQKPAVRPMRYGEKAASGKFDRTHQRPQTQKAHRHGDRTTKGLGINISAAERLERMVHGTLHHGAAHGANGVNTHARGDMPTRGGHGRTSTPATSGMTTLQHGKASTPYTPRAPRPSTREGHYPRPQTSTPRPTTPGSATPWKTSAAGHNQGNRNAKTNRTVAIISFALDYKKYLEHRKKMIQLKVNLAQNSRPNSSSSKVPFRQQLLNQRMRPNSGDGQGRRPASGLGMPGGAMNRPGWTTTAKANNYLDNDNFGDSREFSIPDLGRDHATPVLPKDAFRAPKLLGECAKTQSTNAPPLHKSAPNTPAHAHAHAHDKVPRKAGGDVQQTGSHNNERVLSGRKPPTLWNTSNHEHKAAAQKEREKHDDGNTHTGLETENSSTAAVHEDCKNEDNEVSNNNNSGNNTSSTNGHNRSASKAQKARGLVSAPGVAIEPHTAAHIPRPSSSAAGHTVNGRNGYTASNTMSPPVAATPREGEVHQGDMYVPPRPNTVSGVRTRPPTEGCLENYSFGKALGEGAYAQVYYARHLLTPARREVAIKVYDKYKLSESSRRRGVLREIKILARINHPNIVTFHEALDRTSKIFLVMEYCSGGSLFSLLKRIPGRSLEENHAKRLFYETSTGMKYLHDRYIVHRDIKLENVLLDEFGTIKIIDFGFATVVPPSKKLKAFCGTPSYMAPEIVSRKEYIASAPDIWAMGVLLFAMLIGNFPFKGTNDRDLCRKIIKGVYIIPGKISSAPRGLLTKILEVDMARRMTIDDILHDNFLSSAEAEKKLSTSLHDTSTASTQIGTGQSSKETVNGQIPELCTSGKVQEEAIAKLERLGYARVEILEQLSDETSHLSKLYSRFVKALNAWEK